MPSKTTLTRWFFILISLGIISLILWNTYQFFSQLKDNEREKMRIWASAQEELKKTDLSTTAADNDLLLEILQGNESTPMILYTHKENIYTVKNIDSVTARSRQKLML